LKVRLVPIVKDLWERFTDLISRLREWWKNVGPGVLESFKRLKDPIIELWTNVKESFDQVKQLINAFRSGESDGQGFQRFIDGLVNVIGALIKGLNIAISAMNRFRDILIRIVESKPFQALLSGIGSIGGFVSKVGGKIAGLAEGGIVTKPTLAMVGEGGEPEAVIPLSKMGQMGGGGINITINGAIDPEATARQIRRILQDSERRVGASVAFAR
jgi:SLT domain-containing protein